MISVIIPSYRNPGYLINCINSILLNQTDVNQIIPVIDGHLEIYEPIREILESYTDPIFLPTNVGIAGALNMGVEDAMHEKILLVNEDNVFPCLPWDDVLEGIYHKDMVHSIDQVEPDPGIFGFHTLDLGRDLASFNKSQWNNMSMYLTEPIETDNGHIFPFFMSKTAYLSVGGFDTTYPGQFVSDMDFVYKLQQNGYEFARTHRLHLYHFGSKSTKNRDDDTSGAFSKKMSIEEMQGLKVFRDKWGFFPRRNESNAVV
jgi:GT2 family glycosyltransferase